MRHEGPHGLSPIGLPQTRKYPAVGSIGQSWSMPEQHEHRYREGAVIGNIDGQASHQDLEDCQPGLPEGRNHSEGDEGRSDYDDMSALIRDATSSDDDAINDENADSDDMPALVSDSTTSEDEDGEEANHRIYPRVGSRNHTSGFAYRRMSIWYIALQQEAARTMLLAGVIEASTHQGFVIENPRRGIYELPGRENGGWVEMYVSLIHGSIRSLRRVVNNIVRGLHELRRSRVGSPIRVLLEITLA